MVSVGMGLADRWLRAFLQASIPSLVGMFVYKEDTSSVTSIALEGSSPISLSLLRKLNEWCSLCKKGEFVPEG